MPVLHNIHRIMRESRQRRNIAPTFQPRADFVAWPYLDTLFDYTQVVGAGRTLSAPIPKGAQKRVAIVGAGAAGLCAAFELLKCGVVPTVYEATGRYGGRAWSRHFTRGGVPQRAFAEMGSMRVPPAQKTFGIYANMFDMQPVSGGFPDPGRVPTRLYYENRALDWAANGPPPAPFKGIADAFTDWIDTFANRIYPPWQNGDLKTVQQIWQEWITQYKDVSFYQAVVEGIPSWTSEDLNAFGALGVGSGGFGPLYEINMLELLRIILTMWEDNQQLYENGMTSLCDGFYTTTVAIPGIGTGSLQSQNAVALNTPVIAIDYNPSTRRPMLFFSQSSPVEFDAVIVATTTRSMEVMGLTMPGYATGLADVVSEPVKVALRNLHMTGSSKMFIRTATKFWQAPGVPQNIQTDELPRGIYALDYPQTDDGVVLISYTWEDDAAKLQGLDVPTRFKLLRSIIAKIDPTWGANLVPMNDEIYNVDWQSEPYYHGAFKLNYPGQEPMLQAAYYQFLAARSLDGGDKGIYLAGDGVSYSGGWTEGALQTAINCATAVADRLGGSLPSDNALANQSARLYDYGGSPGGTRSARPAAPRR